MRLDIDRFLMDVEGRYSGRYLDAMTILMHATARQNESMRADAVAELESVITETMGVGEVIGASIVLRRAAAASIEEGEHLRADRNRLIAFRESGTQTLLPRVTFHEALQDLVDRTPVTLRSAAERTAERVAHVYSQGRAMAFAKSAEHAVTERVQALIAQAVRDGMSEADAGQMIRREVDYVREATEPWTDAYSRMAFRTNVNTAVTAGRFRQAQDPDVSELVPCFRFDAVGDSDTRPNHGAADGRIWRVTNTVWQRLAPPLGYSCRCDVHVVTLPELRAMGRVGPNGQIHEDSVPPGAFPDPGFRHGGRPDLFLAG